MAKKVMVILSMSMQSFYLTGNYDIVNVVYAHGYKDRGVVVYVDVEKKQEQFNMHGQTDNCIIVI